MHYSVLRSKYESEFEAKVITEILDFDNIWSRVKIKTIFDENSKEVISEIESESLKDLINTLNDLVKTQTLAEKIINLGGKH